MNLGTTRGQGDRNRCSNHRQQHNPSPGAGSRTALINALGNRTTYDYDATGALVTAQDQPDGRRVVPGIPVKS
ncbi:MAG: hypothetical protein HY320_04980 [Armatimonadetes bacterium]|nr:hypothetical protein [Armatimonadota bacterium]